MGFEDFGHVGRISRELIALTKDEIATPGTLMAEIDLILAR
jgi:hypothetical protein